MMVMPDQALQIKCYSQNSRCCLHHFYHINNNKNLMHMELVIYNFPYACFARKFHVEIIISCRNRAQKFFFYPFTMKCQMFIWDIEACVE